MPSIHCLSTGKTVVLYFSLLTISTMFTSEETLHDEGFPSLQDNKEFQDNQKTKSIKTPADPLQQEL